MSSQSNGGEHDKSNKAGRCHGRLREACRPLMEPLEGRLLFIAATLAGPPEPSGSLSSGSYGFYINATGSSSVLPPSSETFHDGHGNNQLFSSPSNPQPVTQSYSTTAAPTASVTGAYRRHDDRPAQPERRLQRRRQYRRVSGKRSDRQHQNR